MAKRQELDKSTASPSIILIAASMMLAWGGMKLSLPALPELERVFDVPGDAMRATIAAFFVCFALGQLAWGMISDRIGRRGPLLAGLALAAVGSVVVLVSESVIVFGIGRCLEGIGLSAMSPIGRGILFESRPPRQAKHSLGFVSMCTASIPMFGQVIGGYLVAYASWRWIFAAFLAMTLVTMLVVWRTLPETHPRSSKYARPASGRALVGILRNRTFWANALCYITCSGTLLGYYAAMPFWYCEDLSIPVQVYPWLAGFTVGAYILGLVVARRLAARTGGRSLLWAGMFIALLPGLCLMSLWTVEFSTTTTAILLVGASMLLALGAGMVFPGANAGAIGLFPESPGLASAATVTGVFLMAGIMSYLEGHLQAPLLGPIGLTLTIPFVLVIPVVVILARRSDQHMSEVFHR